MQNHILQLLQQHGFVVEESRCCSPDRKIRQRRPRTLQQLETYIRQEWDQIPTPKLQKLITSMPRHLQTVLKRRGDATPSKNTIYIQNDLILYITFLSLNICYVIYVLLWIKYWLMWFEILLVFILFTLKKTSQHFRNSGCIIVVDQYKLN